MKTSGGLTRGDIQRRRVGDGYRYTSKRRSRKGRANPWIQAVMRARRELRIEGGTMIKKGTAWYRLAKRYHGGKSRSRSRNRGSRKGSRKKKSSGSRKKKKSSGSRKKKKSSGSRKKKSRR